MNKLKFYIAFSRNNIINKNLTYKYISNIKFWIKILHLTDKYVITDDNPSYNIHKKTGRDNIFIYYISIGFENVL